LTSLYLGLLEISDIDCNRQNPWIEVITRGDTKIEEGGITRNL